MLYGELRDRPAAAAGMIAACFALVAAIAFADYLTGYEIRLAILYLVPIALATWLVGAAIGALIAIAGAGAWLLTFLPSHPYTHDFYFYWEGGIYAACFLIFVALLTRLRAALKRSDERFVTVLEGLDAAVCVEDARSGAPLYANRRFREEPGGARIAAHEAGEVYDGASQRWFLLQSRPLRWTDGRGALLRMFSDITEERAAHELVDKHRETAHRTSRLVALGEFASAIAHELNQPLAAIATYNNASLRLLQESRPDASEVGRFSEIRQAMEKCRDQAKRAGAIIQRLREVLRYPARVRERLDLNDVARSVLQLAEPQAHEAGVALLLEPGARLPKVRSDRLLVEQVALNLVRNAIEAVQELAPERRRATIATAVLGGQVTLTVSDLGDGVAPEVRERLFEAFVTTKASGLGLGLSVCRSVIESLGGAIHYQPEGARGARFSLALPAVDQ